MFTTEIDADEVLDHVESGLDCSQIVFSEFAPQMGIDRETALKIAASFGGGMWEGETCGAVTGALIALGLKYGHIDNTDKEAMMMKALKFKRRFEAEHGSCICRELLGYKIPEDMEQIMAENKFGTVCNHLIEDSCRICAEILNED